MISFQLKFNLKSQGVKDFLVGSKEYFDKIEKIVSLLTMTIDIKSKTIFKLFEIEKDLIIFTMDIEFDYPEQGYLWGSLNKEAIDQWIIGFSREILSHNQSKTIVLNIENLGSRLGFDGNCIYLKNYVEILENLLDDLKNMSILLFNNLAL